MSHVAQIPPTSAFSVPPENVSDRLLLWHPRFVVCAACTRPAAGFGFRDPHTKSRLRPAASQRRWFCSKHCQALYAHHARKGLNMVDLTEEEHAAITATLKRMGALMGEFGWDARLADLTADQVRALIEEAVEGFRDAMAVTAKSQGKEGRF
jgi:Family of unknown function (DUF6511)